VKRITKLEISNFRAFFDSYTFELNNEENLLIYGENGSGNAGLAKAAVQCSTDTFVQAKS